MNRLSRTALLAGGIAGAFALTTAPAISQGPPGMSAIDKSDPAASKQDANLKPHATPPIVTPVDKLPLDKLKLPAGFKAEVFSSGHPGATHHGAWARRARSSWAPACSAASMRSPTRTASARCAPC